MNTPPALVTDLIRWRAAQTPQRPALWHNGRWFSYAELDTRATQMANRLRELGVKRGDRVGIIALNHPAHIDLMLAAPKLGFIFTPFNYRLSVEETGRLAREVRPAFLFADTRHQHYALQFDCSWSRLSDYKEWLAVGSKTPAAPLDLTGDDIHMLLFTGGSTGLPKGAMIPYRQVWANCVNTAAGWKLTADDCAIQATPCFHAALNVFTTPLFYLGGRVVLMPQFAPGEYLELAEEHRASLMFMVPTMYRLLAEDPNFEDAQLSNVRWAISGGAPCPPTIRAAFAERGIRFKQGYGMTEAGVNCFAISLDEAAEKSEFVGRPLPGTRAEVRRPDGTVCAVGESGELVLSGPHLCAGFWNREEEWQQVFRNGWLHTGDLARVNSAGLFTITGRLKEMYISGGENVYPVEVETALYECAGVAECAVLGIPHEKWGEIGLAAVVWQPEQKLDAPQLQALLKTKLAGYKVPQEFLFLRELPKSGAGKILKPALLELWNTRE